MFQQHAYTSLDNVVLAALLCLGRLIRSRCSHPLCNSRTEAENTPETFSCFVRTLKRACFTDILDLKTDVPSNGVGYFRKGECCNLHDTTHLSLRFIDSLGDFYRNLVGLMTLLAGRNPTSEAPISLGQK